MTEGALPPHDLEAEAAVLSAVMLDPALMDRVGYLEPSHFYSEAHRQIWTAICELRDEGKVRDVLMVQSRLKDTSRLAQVGGTQYLTTVLDAAPTVSNVPAYAAQVVARWRLRQTILAAQRVVAAGYASRVTDVQTFTEDAARSFVDLVRTNPAGAPVTNDQIFRRMVEAMYAVSQRGAGQRSSKTLGLPTGIQCLDAETMGLQPGQKTTLAAESGRGKTTLAIQLAMHAAGWRGLDRDLAEARVAVRFFSTEQTKEEVAIKQLSLAASVDSKRLARQLVDHVLTAEEWQRVTMALPLIERLALFVDDRAAIDVDQIVTACSQQAQESVVADGVPLGLVVVDYVQRLKPVPSKARDREDQQIGHSTQLLKEMAKDLNLPVLELAQMNPPDRKLSSSGRPYQWLVSQCKRVEKEADHMWYLWRVREGDKSGARITCTKQRGGEEFDVDLLFEPEYSRFHDPAWKGFMSAFEGFT